jgi:hypothetical protein
MEKAGRKMDLEKGGRGERTCQAVLPWNGMLNIKPALLSSSLAREDCAALEK